MRQYNAFIFVYRTFVGACNKNLHFAFQKMFEILRKIDNNFCSCTCIAMFSLTNYMFHDRDVSLQSNKQMNVYSFAHLL